MYSHLVARGIGKSLGQPPESIIMRLFITILIIITLIAFAAWVGENTVIPTGIPIGSHHG